MATERYTLNDYLHAFRRRFGIFLAVFVAVFATAIAFAVVPPDVYRASAELRIDLEGPNINVVQPMILTNYADQYIQSLQQKVLSNENLRTWLEETDVYRENRDSASQGELMQRLEEDIRIQMVFTSVIDEATGKEVNLITGFTTSFTGHDPAVAEDIAQKVAASFLAEDRATRMASAATASGFLQERIDAKREEIVAIEAQIATFKEGNSGKLPDNMVLNMTALERTEREFESVEREIRVLEQDRFFREAQLQEIRQRGGGIGATLAALEAEYHRAISLYGPDHPDVIRISRQVAALTEASTSESGSLELAQLEAELAAAEERYSDEHPDVIRLKRQIAAARSGGAFPVSGQAADPVYLQLSAQINAIDTNLSSLRTRANDLRVHRADLQDKIAAMPQVERQYQVLERELQTATLAFEDLRKRLTQAEQIESFESGERGARLTLIRSAKAPDSPTGPPRIAISVLGLIVALTLASGGTLITELSDSTIRGSKDVLTVLNTHAIAIVPIVQNSVSRSYRRKQMVFMSIGVLVIAGAIMVIARTIGV